MAQHEMPHKPTPCFPCMEPLKCRFISQVAGGGVKFLSGAKNGTSLDQADEKRAPDQEFRVHSIHRSDMAVSLIQSCTYGGFLAVAGAADKRILCFVASDKMKEDDQVELCTLLRCDNKESASGRTNQSYMIRTMKSEMTVLCDDNGNLSFSKNSSLSKDINSRAGHWRMEILSGELCFLQNNGGDDGYDTAKNISLDWNGKLSAVDVFSGDGVWRLVDTDGPDGLFWINSWTHDDKVLSCDGDGKVSISDLKLPLVCTALWCASKIEGRGVLIKSVESGMYLVLRPDKDIPLCVVDDLDRADSFYWYFESANRNIFRVATNEALHASTISHHNDKDKGERGNKQLEPRYLSVASLANKSLDLKARMVCCTSKQSESTEWKLEYTSNGSMTMRYHEKSWSSIAGAHDGHLDEEAWFLAADNNAYAPSILTLSKKMYRWRAHGSLQQFVFQPQGEEPLCLALEQGKNQPTFIEILGVDRPENSAHTWIWALEPCLPDKGTTKSQMWGIGLGVFAAATGAFVAPSVVMWGVGAYGLGSSGILRRSSAEASATVGMLGVGDTAVTQQSIGATGPAAIGNFTTGDKNCGTYAEEDVRSEEARQINRPFAAFKSW